MIIDNGQQVRLVIDGVFEGSAGFSRGVLAFIPNRTGRKPEYAKVGQVDGADVRLAVVKAGGWFNARILDA